MKKYFEKRHILFYFCFYSILELQNDRIFEQLKAKWWDNNPLKQDCPVVGAEMAGLTIQNIGKAKH